MSASSSGSFRVCGICRAHGFADFGEHAKSCVAAEVEDVWVCSCGLAAPSFDAIVTHCLEFGHCPSRVSRSYDQRLLQAVERSSFALTDAQPPPPPPLPKAAKLGSRKKRSKAPTLQGPLIRTPRMEEGEEEINALNEPGAAELWREESGLLNREHEPGQQLGLLKLKQGPDGRLACPLCPTSYETTMAANAHLFKRHGIKKGRSNYCQICNLFWPNFNAYLAHNKEAHPGLGKQARIHCGLCSASQQRIGSLVRHLNEDHGRSLPVQQMTFRDEIEYEAWLLAHHALDGLRKKHIHLKTPKGLTTYYQCRYNSKGKAKEEGLQQPPPTCSAYLKVVARPDGAHEVAACLSHYLDHGT